MNTAKILIVDDALSVRETVCMFFTKHGFSITSAYDGQNGLDKLAADPDIKLVFADVNMPNMNGIEMTEHIFQTLKRDVTVIMLTTDNNPAMKEEGKAVGVMGWMVKPFTGDNILDTVKKIVAD